MKLKSYFITMYTAWVFLVCAFAFSDAQLPNARVSGKEFDENIDYHDPDTGEVLRLKSKGRFKNVIDIDSVPGLKRILCVSNKLIFAMENSQEAASWMIDDVLMGGDAWECQLGLSHAPDKGIFRKITSIKFINGQKVEAVTTEASFFDMIDYADIFYHHTPAVDTGNTTSNETAYQHRRLRRKRALSFPDLTKPWEVDTEVSREINYDRGTGAAAGKFGVALTATKDLGFEAKENTWFQREKNVETDTEKIISESLVKSRITCNDCSAFFKTGLTYELSMDRTPGGAINFKKYILQLDAETKLNYDLEFNVEGEYSASYDRRLWKSKTPSVIDIPILPLYGVSLRVTLGAELWLAAAFEANAKLTTTMGFHSLAKFVITHQKIGNNPATLTTSKVLEPFVPHNPKTDFIAVASGSFSVYPNIEIGMGIAWGYKPLFQITFLSPVAFAIKPEVKMEFELASSLGTALVGSLDIVLDVSWLYELRPVKFEFYVIGVSWFWDILELEVKGSVSLIEKPLTLVSAEKLTCPVARTITCDKASKPITVKTDKRLTRFVDNSQIIFKTDLSHYMSGIMKEKIDRFSDLLEKEGGWSTRKLIIKTAWSSSATGLGAEGRQVRLGITLPGATTQSTETKIVDRLLTLAKCAGFCDVVKSGSDVIVRVKGESTDFKGNKYITNLLPSRKDILRVYDLPVGQGDATIVQCSDGSLSVVDMGTSSSDENGFWGEYHVTSFLSKRNINKIEHIFITHADEAHYNLIEALSKEIEDPSNVTLYFSSGSSIALIPKFSSKMKKMPVFPCQSDATCPVWEICPDVEMHVVGSGLGASGDDNGLVLRLEQDTFSMLFVGDLSSLTATNKLDSVESDVYKLSNHGSKDAAPNSASFLAKVKPSVIISSGDPWDDVNMRTPRCVSTSIAIQATSLATQDSSHLKYREQRDYSCGGDISGVTRKTGNTVAFYTHAPTVGSINMIQITYSSATKIIKVVPKRMITDLHNGASRRKRREAGCSGDGEEDTRRKRREAGCSGDGEEDTTTAGSDFPTLEWCEGKFPALTVGKSEPVGTMIDTCGPIIHPITRDDDRFESLYYYVNDDVMFSNEERLDAWCGTKNRKCVDCREISEDDTESINQCSERFMSFRLGYRLRRLAFLTAQQFNGDKVVKVLEAWDEPTSSNPTGKHVKTSLHYEGRAAQLVLDKGTAADLKTLSHLAQCAGFDYVKLSSSNLLEVCVFSQESTVGEMVSFHGAQLLAVKLPSFLEFEFGYPAALTHETEQTKLFDGYKISLPISEHFTIGDFICPGKRFFRLDEKLVECLEQIKDGFTDFSLVKGSTYRTHSKNIADLSTRHKEEKYRYQTGQAVELNIKKGSSKTLIGLAQQIIRACVHTLELQQMILGLGAHADRIYVDIRPTPIAANTRLKVWEVGKSGWFKELEEMASQVNAGGIMIDPVNKERACKATEFGIDYYISIKIEDDKTCSDDEPTFCKDTKNFRVTAVKEFEQKLKKILGKRTISTADVKACLVDNCGCGIGIGSSWKNKVLSCLKFLKNYVTSATVPFRKPEKAGFFNTDSSNSSVHSLACNKGVCLENTQIYSILAPVLFAKYKPNPKESIEEKLYGARDNPNPALDLLEQIMAMNVKGDVNVFIDSDMDISSLNNVIKILMVYNTKVSSVTFHVASSANKGKVQDALSRKTEFWATGACPDVSRFAIAPYSVVDISDHRRKRSLDDSAHRNYRMNRVHEFEHHWIMKN